MSDQNNNGKTGGGPKPSSSGPRIGRIGQWGGSDNTPSNSRSSSGARFATLRDLGSSNARPGPPPGHSVGHPPGHLPDDDSNSESEGDSKEGQTWFTGGERSGLAVQNPNHHPGGSSAEVIQNLLRKAQEAGYAPSRAVESSTAFSGTGHTLGSDDVESQLIPDPNALPGTTSDGRAVRRVNFWRNGFTIEDGPLLSYDDPNNAEILRAMDTGQAPAALLNVHYGQDVQLHVQRRLHEDYVAPQHANQAFEGVGHRLGAPTPPIVGAGGTSASPATTIATTATASRADEAQSLQTKFEVDHSQPTIVFRLRFADGSQTRMVRMNLTHTIRDLRNYINASRPENLARSYTISLFPNRVLGDESQTIEAAGLENSVVIQRWD